MQDRGSLMTELRNPRSQHLDQMSIAAAFDLINSEDATVPQAVAGAKAEIVSAIKLVVSAFKTGGRLIYIGAGTSGRLGVVDASECPPSFLTDPEMVQGVIAGGDGAMFRAVEGAEDSEETGAEALKARGVGPRDVVFGIATGGTTPFVHGAIRHARQIGAGTVFLACVPADQWPDEADVSIRVVVGPEVITGSTRMKAGTASKLVFNMVTTIAMVQMGKVYENLMVDVNAYANRKLIDRGARIIREVTGLSREEALKLLDAAQGRVKAAIVMHHKGVDVETAQGLLDQHEGKVMAVLRG
jgi:N-acetylmuramic acid 6-phosphate etherase